MHTCIGKNTHAHAYPHGCSHRRARRGAVTGRYIKVPTLQVQYVALRKQQKRPRYRFKKKQGEMKYALWSISSVATKKTRIQELESP